MMGVQLWSRQECCENKGTVVNRGELFSTVPWHLILTDTAMSTQKKPGKGQQVVALAMQGWDLHQLLMETDERIT